MIEKLYAVEPLLFPILLRCLVATLCGVMIGMERAYKAKPAGIRTHMLISLGSCLFMGVSLLIGSEARKLGYVNADPARIAAQVVAGIGFIGAGTIIRNKGLVRGMTSAAAIWCMAAIGLAAGAGMLITAFSCSFGIVIILRVYDYIEDKIRIERFRIKSIDVVVKKEALIPDIRNTLRNMDITLSHERVNHILNEVHYQATMLIYGNIEDEIEKEIKKIKGAKYIVILTPGDAWEG